MKHLSVLIKPASSLCNMRCSYCFYHDVSSLREVKSFGIMTQEVMERMIDNIFKDLNDGDVMTFAFQGGEPTLAGLTYFSNFISYVKKQTKKIQVHYLIQTNGLIIDEQWCAFFKEHQFLVGLSIDGDKTLHDDNRLNANYSGTYKRVMETKALFDTFQVEYNVLCVLTNQMARHPQRIFKFLKNENIRYVQFIPCLDDLNCGSSKSYALQPERFASFYNALFKLWLNEFVKGNYISIKLFDDVTHLLKTGRGMFCGMLGRCQSQYVIEADGSTYPCDFYVIDEYKMGNVTEHTLFEMRNDPTLKQFLTPKKTETFCSECPYFKICFGGCKRMKHHMYVNKSGTYCGYQDFLKTNIHHLQRIAKQFY